MDQTVPNLIDRNQTLIVIFLPYLIPRLETERLPATRNLGFD